MSHEELQRLVRDLRRCQRRLGTPDEANDDFDRVLNLAHEINNRIAVEYTRAFLDPVPAGPKTLLALSREIAG